MNHPVAIKSCCITHEDGFDNNGAIYLVVNTCNRILLKILQIKPNTDGNVTEEEIKAFIRERNRRWISSGNEQDIVERVFHIGDRKVNSLMTHRKSVVFYLVLK
jgi:putative hemolysin